MQMRGTESLKATPGRVIFLTEDVPLHVSVSSKNVEGVKTMGVSVQKLVELWYYAFTTENFMDCELTR